MGYVNISLISDMVLIKYVAFILRTPFSSPLTIFGFLNSDIYTDYISMEFIGLNFSRFYRYSGPINFYLHLIWNIVFIHFLYKLIHKIMSPWICEICEICEIHEIWLPSIWMIPNDELIRITKRHFFSWNLKEMEWV